MTFAKTTWQTEVPGRDPEIDVLVVVWTAVENLSPSAQVRVLRWALERAEMGEAP